MNVDWKAQKATQNIDQARPLEVQKWSEELHTTWT